MRRIKQLTGYFAAMLLLAAATTGCKKYLDVNKNVNAPTGDVVPVSLLLTNAERNIGSVFAIGSGLGTNLGVYTHQIIGRIGADRYGVTGAGADGSWNTLYNTISNLNVIITKGTAENRFVYTGIAKILKAYAYSMMVDVWGEIPFSEHDKFTDGITQPKFDKGVDIYPQLLKLIDEGIADLDNTTVNPSKPGKDDLIYGGYSTSNQNWKKAANTLKLKMYTQIRKVQDVSAAVTALLANPSMLINSQAESFMLPFGPNGTTDDRYPGYSEYTATQRGSVLPSHWLYEIMKGRNADIYSGIEDPRIPYYFYRQKTASGSPENCTEYRDGGFITIVFASTGPCHDGSNSSTYSMFGIYPVGGRYDDGTGQTITALGGGALAGTGAAPQRMITYADRLYLEAELIHAGLAPGDEKAVFSAALNASFAQVDYVVSSFVKPNQTVPVIATSAATTAYKTSILNAFDASNANRKLEHIMTQKWIQRLGNSTDNYTDYRRTGYPVMFAPTPSGMTVPTPVGNPIPVSNNVKYPLSYPWSNNELQLNKNAPAQKIPESYKIFWQP